MQIKTQRTFLNNYWFYIDNFLVMLYNLNIENYAITFRAYMHFKSRWSQVRILSEKSIQTSQ